MRSRSQILQVLLIFAAVSVLARKHLTEVLGFVAPRFSPSSRPVAVPTVNRQPQRPLTSRAAEVASSGGPDDDEDDGGFLKFLKVENDDANLLSPEEYKQALVQEIEVERKKLYIGGQVKPGNLIVPWKAPDEAELEVEAREKLKKTGIYDPEGDPEEMKEAGIEITLDLIGGQDVDIKWQVGDPGNTVGYIIERKRAQDPNFYEIVSYEEAKVGDSLMAKSYAGAKYNFNDQLVPSGSWTYRVVCRDRMGQVSIIDTKDLVVPVGSQMDSNVQAIVFVVGLLGALGLTAIFAELKDGM